MNSVGQWVTLLVIVIQVALFILMWPLYAEFYGW